MSKTKRTDSLKRKHWSIKAHESLISRNAEGNFCLNVEGGAESGLMPFVGDIRQDRINYQSGKLHSGEIILEVNSKRVAGMIKKDVIALIKRSADPVSLVSVKQNATITKDLRQYLATRFTKNSVDSELQHHIRENLHLRAIPCTTRRPQSGERPGVDYNFVSTDEFKRLEKSGQFLESGVYEGNYYGTPKPPADPPGSSIVTSPSGGLNMRDGPPPPLPSHRGPPNLGPLPRNLGPLPGNWEIAYTDNNEKYFIDHNTGTTHWMDPRLATYMKHSLLECSDGELPYGWEKVSDPVYGTYFIDHINRTTQYENPVHEAKRKYAGAQLTRGGAGVPPYGEGRGPPPPLQAPPSMQTAAALEKQREAEAAAKWPEAGLTDYLDGPYPSYQSSSYPLEQELEAELQGEPISTSLTKTSSGFGFTIIGGDRPRDLLQIKNILPGSLADRDGRLKVGDVIVRINGISVLTYNHKKVVDLFQGIPINSDVTIEVRRGYPLPDYRNDELPAYSDSNQSYGQPPMAGGGYVEHYEPQQEEVVDAFIVKGPFGFGFSIGESARGPMVKQIMDAPRCAQLREGDVIMEVNGERVQDFLHSDLVTVLKRCPKGNQAKFTVLRPVGFQYPEEEQFPYFPGGEGYAPMGPSSSSEPFTVMEVHLIRQVSGFGFRIIGGQEEGSQATVGCIVAGGAADLDGRLMAGDEITHINHRSVMDSTHRDVIALMGEAAAKGEVTLRIQRKMPMPESVPLPNSSQPPPPPDDLPPLPPMGVREVDINRPDTQTSFGFVLQSNTLRTGCMICRLIQDSPADLCGKLYVYDELLCVNGKDVSKMDHSDIVALIKASGTTIKLVVQQPENLDMVEEQMVADQPAPMQQAVAVPMENRGFEYHSNERGYPPSHGHHQMRYDDEVGPQISADLDDIPSEDEEIIFIEFERDESGFGFSIRGGAEYNAPLCVLRIAEAGAAEKNGRLKVGDELLEINGNSTEGMLHSDAITIIKHGGGLVRLQVRRVNEESFGGFGTPEHKLSSHEGTPGPPQDPHNSMHSTKERYMQSYMNSLGRGRRSTSPPPHQ